MSELDHVTSSVFFVGVRFPDDSAEEVQKQKQLLKDAATFLISCQIPSFVSDLIHTQSQIGLLKQ